jgi:hypothetical protein
MSEWKAYAESTLAAAAAVDEDKAAFIWSGLTYRK